jgi:hypothetical protein
MPLSFFVLFFMSQQATSISNQSLTTSQKQKLLITTRENFFVLERFTHILTFGPDKHRYTLVDKEMEPQASSHSHFGFFIAPTVVFV